MILESRECRRLDELSQTAEGLKEVSYATCLYGDPQVVERNLRLAPQRAERLAMEGSIKMIGIGDLWPVTVSPEGHEMDRLLDSKVHVIAPQVVSR